MTDLTEQLYAGTLPTGHYYFNNGVETYIVLYKNINSKHLILQEPEGLTVISEVPSCEEWKKAYECVVSENEEITTFKKLMKECREHLITYKKDNIDKGCVVYDGSYLINKINQALGEDK